MARIRRYPNGPPGSSARAPAWSLMPQAPARRRTAWWLQVASHGLHVIGARRARPGGRCFLVRTALILLRLPWPLRRAGCHRYGSGGVVSSDPLLLVAQGSSCGHGAAGLSACRAAGVGHSPGAATAGRDGTPLAVIRPRRARGQWPGWMRHVHRRRAPGISWPDLQTGHDAVRYAGRPGRFCRAGDALQRLQAVDVGRESWPRGSDSYRRTEGGKMGGPWPW